jgi:hypothetical protein
MDTLTARKTLYCTATDSGKTLFDCGFTEGDMEDVVQVELTPHGGPINVLMTGDEPTNDEGHYVEDKGLGQVYGENDCRRMKMVRSGDVDVKVTVTIFVP